MQIEGGGGAYTKGPTPQSQPKVSPAAPTPTPKVTTPFQRDQYLPWKASPVSTTKTTTSPPSFFTTVATAVRSAVQTVTTAVQSAVSRLGPTMARDPVQANRFQLKNDPGSTSAPFLTRVSGFIANAIGTVRNAFTSPQPASSRPSANPPTSPIRNDGFLFKNDPPAPRPGLLPQQGLGPVYRPNDGDALARAADSERQRLKQQCDSAWASGDMEIVRGLNALLGNPERLEAYVAERAQIGLAFDQLAQANGAAPAVDKNAFITAAQGERNRLAEQVRDAEAKGDIESVRALRALVDDPQRASDYVLQRTLASVSYDAAQKDPQAAAFIAGLGKEEYSNILQRAQGDLADQRRQIDAKLAKAATPAETAALTAQRQALDQGGDHYLTAKLAEASQSKTLERKLAAGGVDPDTAAYYQGLLKDPAMLAQRGVLGPDYAREADAQARAAAVAARASGKDPKDALANTRLIDARSQFALVYRDAQKGNGDPALVRDVQAGKVSLDAFVNAGAKSFEAKLEQQKADVDIAHALLQRNPSRTPEQAAADARGYNSLFFAIKGSQTAFQEKIDAFNAMPSYYRGASREQTGYDIYAQKDEIGRQYNDINAKFRDYEALVVAGEAATPQARQVETEVRRMLAKVDALSRASIDASLGRAATVGPVVDMITDVLVMPAGPVASGLFGAGKALVGGERDAGNVLLASARSAAFSEIGVLAKAGTFARLGTKVLPQALQGIKWLPGAVAESTAMGLTSASLTAVDLARQGKLDAGLVAASGFEGFGFGLANAGMTRAGASLAQRFLGAQPGVPSARAMAADVVSGGLSGMAGDAVMQLAADGRIDLGRVALSGLASGGATVALSRLSYLETKARMPAPASPGAAPGDSVDAPLRPRALTVGDAQMRDIQTLAAGIVTDEHRRAGTSPRDALRAVYEDKDFAARVVNAQSERNGIPTMLVRVDEGVYVKLAGQELVDAVRAGDAGRVAESLKSRKPGAAALYDADSSLKAAVASGDVLQVIKHLRGDPAPHLDLSSLPGRASVGGSPSEPSEPSGPPSSPPRLPNRLVTTDEDLIQLRALGAHGGPQSGTPPLRPEEIDLVIGQMNRNYAQSGVHAAVVRVGDDVVKLEGSELIATFRAGDAEAAAAFVRAAATTPAEPDLAAAFVRAAATTPAEPDLAAAVVRGDSETVWNHLWGPLPASPTRTKPSLDLERPPYEPTPGELTQLRGRLAPDLEKLPLDAMGYTGDKVDELVKVIASTKDYALRVRTTGEPFTDQWVKTSIERLHSPSGATARLTVVWQRDPDSGEVQIHRVWMDGPGATR